MSQALLGEGPSGGNSGRAGCRATLCAEWIKVRTGSGSAWLLAGLVVLTVATSAAAVAATRCPTGMSCPVDITRLSLSGVQFGAVVVAVLAILPVCNEYSTGMIRVTLAAMPRRATVITAKACISATLVLVASAIAVLGSLLAGRLILPDHGFSVARGFGSISLTDGPTLRAAAGSVLDLVLVAILCVGIAAVVRDSALAVGVALGLLYLFPVIAGFVGNPTWHNRLERYTPMAGLNIQATTGLRSLAITPWAGLGVLALWAAAALAGGLLVITFRDA
jgi:ABC-2 type transport system permease protein